MVRHPFGKSPMYCKKVFMVTNKTFCGHVTGAVPGDGARADMQRLILIKSKCYLT